MPDLGEFTHIVQEHHSSLRFYIQGLGVNPAWVDDIAQDTFLVAYRKWQEFESVENPGAWLRAIARNLVLNETAKLNRRQRLLDHNLTSLLLGEEAAPAVIPEKVLEGLVDWRESLRACLGTLSHRAQSAVQLHYFGELKSGEIGERFSMTPVAVRKLLFHARQALAECLRQKIADAGS